VVREQRLVRGDDVLAVGKRIEDEFLRDRRAADQLDDDVDVLRARDLVGVGGDVRLRADDLARPAVALSATRVMRIARPARRWISSPLRPRTSQTPLPTVPMPSSPTRIGRIRQRPAAARPS
jgi:hypothetical protein